MSSKAREVEILITAMYAAIPLYANDAISPAAVALFHIAFALLTIAALRGRQVRLPAPLLQTLAVAYLLFFPIDAVAISGSLISASGNLVFFIALFQALDAVSARRLGQRLVVVMLVFITSLATSTNLSIVFFVIGFALLAFRQLMRLSRESSIEETGSKVEIAPSSLKPALFYMLPTAAIAIAMFPALPRLHNPLVRGLTAGLSSSTTGLSDTIDFGERRSISPDGTVVARVWMPRDAVLFFTPLRLRGAIYDAWESGEWKAARDSTRFRSADRGRIDIAQQVGFSRDVIVQQNLGRDRRIFIPSGTHAIVGLDQVEERQGIFRSMRGGRGALTYTAKMSRRTRPLAYVVPTVLSYPIRPEIAQLARSIVGNERSPEKAAALIERHLSTRFQYVANPAALGRPVSVDEFLLTVKRGHCEYFAAGMVVLMKALNIPARIVGGYYGGKLNPLTGYFTIAKTDAHAWVEVYDGSNWLVFDPTPAALRPGNQPQGIVRAYASALADSVNYFWDRYILTYGLADQIALLTQAVERGLDAWRALRRNGRTISESVFSLTTLYALAVMILIVAAAVRFYRSRRPAYAQLLDLLSRNGIDVGESTAPLELLDVVRRARPEIAGDAEEVIRFYVREKFAPSPPSRETRSAARAALRRMARAL